MEIGLGLLRTHGLKLLRGTGGLTLTAARYPASTARVAAAFLPLAGLLAREGHITSQELGRELDRLFETLYQHPLTAQGNEVTRYLREQKVLPNEETTEGLIRYVVEQTVARSPIPVPQQIIDEFWTFFHELMSEPELRGLADLGLDIVRLVLRTYEPLLADVINELKDIVYANQNRIESLLRRVRVVRGDLQIIRRQIKALRYVRPFFQADAKDFNAQAQIVAQMVREFGPFFIKMAQVAAATADFLPDEIARELMVFQEDVAPMSAQEARDAIIESFGRPPEAMYFGFNADKPLKSGSIGSIYLAKKPMTINGVEQLVPVVVKIGRHNLDREFLMGKTSIGLMLLSSQYWAPHGKLAPFLKAMSAQIDTFIEGFRGELQFEHEAEVQAKFSRRAQHSSVWRVPRVYQATERVIEMEFVEGAVNISRAVAPFRAARCRGVSARAGAKASLHRVEPGVRPPRDPRRSSSRQRHGRRRRPPAPDRLGQLGGALRQARAGAQLPPRRARGRRGCADRRGDRAQHGHSGGTGAPRRDSRGARPHPREEGHQAVVRHVPVDAVSRRQRGLAEARQPARPPDVEHPAPGDRHTRRLSAAVALDRGRGRHAGQPLQGRAAPAGARRPAVAFNSFPARVLQDTIRGGQAEIADVLGVGARAGKEAPPPGKKVAVDA